MRSANSTNKRCAWARVDDPLLLRYHDREWAVPVHSDSKHFEVLVLSGVQAGLNWSLVLEKREGYRRAFDNFDPDRVARYSERRVEKLTSDPETIRNRMKIEAAVSNARTFLKIQEEFGKFDPYCWRFCRRAAQAQPVESYAADSGSLARIRNIQQGSRGNGNNPRGDRLPFQPPARRHSITRSFRKDVMKNELLRRRGPLTVGWIVGTASIGCTPQS